MTTAERDLLLDRLDSFEQTLNGLGERLAIAQLEPWLTKRQLADHLGVSARWIEDRVGEGLPHRALAGGHKFRLSQVEPWMTKHGYLSEEGER